MSQAIRADVTQRDGIRRREVCRADSRLQRWDALQPGPLNKHVSHVGGVMEACVIQGQASQGKHYEGRLFVCEHLSLLWVNNDT